MHPSDVIKIVANHFSMPAKEMLGPARDHQHARPRMMAMQLCRERFPSLSESQICDSFNGKSRGCVRNASKTILGLEDAYRDISETMDELRAKVGLNGTEGEA